LCFAAAAFSASFLGVYILPRSLRIRYILILPFLRTTAEQDDKPFSIRAEVDSVPRPKVDSVLGDTLANGLNGGRISLSKPLQSCGGFDGRSALFWRLMRRCTGYTFLLHARMAHDSPS
jgi:hypothetical protein